MKIDRVKSCITWEPENVMTFSVHFSPMCTKLNATARVYCNFLFDCELRDNT